MEQFIVATGFNSLSGAVTILSGILVGVVIALLTGALVPRKTHLERLRDRDQIISYLKEANEQLTGATVKFANSGEATEKLHASMHEKVQEVNNARPGTSSG